MFTRRKLLACLTPVLSLVLWVACAAPAGTVAGTPEPLHLVLLHTNDIHGQVLPRRATWIKQDPVPVAGGLPRLAAEVHRVRREERADVLVLDAGDWYQGTPEGMIDVGLSFVSGLVAVGYDAMSLGNHEFDHGLENVRRLLDQGGPPAICANVFDPATGERIDWVEPYRIVEVAGLRVALIGLLTTETPEITHAEARTLEFVDPVEAFTAVRAELGDQVDLCIPVGHIGIETGRRLAVAHPDLPVVVTGHSHTFLNEGLLEGETLIVQAGCKATVLGRVDLWLDARTHALVRSQAQLLDLLDEPAPEDRIAEIDVLCAVLVAESEVEMATVAGELDGAPSRRSLTGERTSSTPAGNWICDAMLMRTGADVALHNRGGTRVDLEAGLVTHRDLFELLPFDNDLVTMTLTGAELESVVRQSIADPDHAPLDYGGMRALVDRVSLELVAVEIAGEPLEPAREYRVTTNSFLGGGGDAYVALVAGGSRITDPIPLRELMILHLELESPVTPPTDERIALVEQ